MIKRRFEHTELSVQGISHGFFTRQGGVSSGIYSSLNCGYGSDDAWDNVRQNRATVSGLLGAPDAPLITVHQTHSCDVVTADKPWSQENAPKADAIVTNKAKLILGVLTADCAPVLFASPSHGIIGAAHAGWRGAFNGILENTVDAMVKLGACRRDIIATVGPALGIKNYEVGPEFYDEFVAKAPENSRYFEINDQSQKHHFNLTDFALSRLKKTGISKVFSVDECTYENESLFFSYRRNSHQSIADYGRQISTIVIN